MGTLTILQVSPMSKPGMFQMEGDCLRTAGRSEVKNGYFLFIEASFSINVAFSDGQYILGGAGVPGVQEKPQSDYCSERSQ